MLARPLRAHHYPQSGHVYFVMTKGKGLGGGRGVDHGGRVGPPQCFRWRAQLLNGPTQYLTRQRLPNACVKLKKRSRTSSSPSLIGWVMSHELWCTCIIATRHITNLTSPPRLDISLCCRRRRGTQRDIVTQYTAHDWHCKAY